MWILPKQLHTSAFALDTAALISDLAEQSQICEQSLLARSKPSLADRMDDAELFVTCDNRTDELRMLGNGVVPVTATRAFRVLMEQLLNENA